MIDIQKYKDEILSHGLLLDHYFVLCSIKNGEKIDGNKRIQGFVNLLTKKGYIYEDCLTEKALDLIQNCILFEPIPVDSTEKKEEDLGTWITGLHSRLEKKMTDLTGRRQVRDKINGKYYSFLPNSVDLGKVMTKVITLYKLKDLEKIEQTIMSYMEQCSQAGSWFPILQYYIMKNGSSSMVTDMSSDVEASKEFKSPQKFV